MKKRILFHLVVSLALLATSAFRISAANTGNIVPPPVPREFRAAWITTVWNLNWPSKAGLPVAQQKSELITMLDKAAKLNLNAIVLQVRGSGDAFYASPTEPWSHFLTGTQGKAPEPFYDPLAFAIDEAHKRGLELHAWFNPFRVRVTEKQELAANHVSKRHPEFVRKYDKFLWIDPGDVFARDYGIQIMTDVVKRYDVDGIQIDDYFYPSVAKDAAGKPIPFDDEHTWQRYLKTGGKLARDDWRRENINIFIQRVYAAIKQEKRWVKFGVSPPGIWRPGNPPIIKGWDVYKEIYADAKKWLNHGWMDYLAPQLYWKISATNQSFPVLLSWWEEQSKRGRHVWPGLNTVEVGQKFDVPEIVNQIKITRNGRPAPGHVHFDIRSLVRNTKNINQDLQKLYAQPAVIPAMPWLGRKAPEKPKVTVKSARETKDGLMIVWKSAGTEPVGQWIFQKKTGSEWTTDIVHGSQMRWRLKDVSKTPDYVAITAVSRNGLLSPPTVVAVR